MQGLNFLCSADGFQNLRGRKVIIIIIIIIIM